MHISLSIYIYIYVYIDPPPVIRNPKLGVRLWDFLSTSPRTWGPVEWASIQKGVFLYVYVFWKIFTISITNVQHLSKSRSNLDRRNETLISYLLVSYQVGGVNVYTWPMLDHVDC